VPPPSSSKIKQARSQYNAMCLPVIPPPGSPSAAPATPPTGADTDGEWPFIYEPEPEQDAAADSGVASPVVQPMGNSPPVTSPLSTPPPADDDDELPFAVPQLMQDATQSVIGPPVVQLLGSTAPATALPSTPPPSTPPPAADTSYELPFAVPGPTQEPVAAAIETTSAGSVRAVGQEKLLHQLQIGQWEQ